MRRLIIIAAVLAITATACFGGGDDPVVATVGRHPAAIEPPRQSALDGGSQDADGEASVHGRDGQHPHVAKVRRDLFGHGEPTTVLPTRQAAPFDLLIHPAEVFQRVIAVRGAVPFDPRPHDGSGQVGVSALFGS